MDLVKKVEIKANQVDKHFYDKYKLNESDESANQFGISSFERIGWADPFPNDNAILTIEKDLSQNKDCLSDPCQIFIYPNCKILVPESTPMQSYIPSKVMMFKMMKSCINIKELEKLWVNI